MPNAINQTPESTSSLIPTSCLSYIRDSAASDTQSLWLSLQATCGAGPFSRAQEYQRSRGRDSMLLALGIPGLALPRRRDSRNLCGNTMLLSFSDVVEQVTFSWDISSSWRSNCWLLIAWQTLCQEEKAQFLPPCCQRLVALGGDGRQHMLEYLSLPPGSLGNAHRGRAHLSEDWRHK